MKPTWLLEYRQNIYSHDGEDGIIEKILDLIPDKNKWCVEFGAWDGIYLSNTRNLIVNREYGAVLIEGSAAKFEELKRNNEPYKQVIPVCTFVGFNSADNLDAILSSTPIPLDFDFLSIDVDGNDYHIWSAMSRYRPKVVCIEFNPTIPTSVHFVQEANPHVTRGASLSSLVDLARRKGYELVSVLSVNAIFVRKEYFSLFMIEDNRSETLRTDETGITYLCVGYDGHVFTKGYSRLPWHDLPIDAESLQQLPKWLRTYPHNYGRTQKIGYAAHLFFNRRAISLRSMISRIWRIVRGNK